ncbi:PP2C family protein-serine/threonine phosphatase [Mycoplasmopsis pullorum]|uniref:PPM-type phosphatase domain-containing protein n=1 Tax=Mycoplasmopsis pullorum TaxID=48003 RepID=A0A1L4FRF6_9BACT|nr:protein phosphatase 2C domain-containing protein [Mycoplasmopsis pullorum]APJ38181.1 hypothetical protein BLA55_00550 [Mycoplasmopsis pullorum]TNK83306.1 serine/threonine-protein phosphatase [Mycoplasmopsis pullorum]TNK92126.1 serine/threonine-protein phosphatase [Mycoplasmopsis pullorum]
MIFVSRSEKGKRQSNQDRVGVFENKDTIFAILCDGMGGHSGGEIASSLAVNFLSREFVNNFNYKKDDVKLWFDINIDKLKRLMVREVKENDESLMEMGTTITGVLIIKKENRIYFFNCGDSRGYALLKNGALNQITVDQNVFNLLNSNGQTDLINRYKQTNSLWKLTSAVGPKIATTLEIFELEAKHFPQIKKILLTSDGIHGAVDFKSIELILSSQNSIDQIANKLLDEAILGDSTDNMSLIILDME